MGTPATQPSMMQFEIVRNVTIPFYIIPADGTPSYLRFETAIEPDKTTFSERVRRSRKDADGKQTDAPPMNIAQVTNLQTGEVCRLVAHQVLQSNLEEAYKDASYVGKCFQIKKSKSKGRYFNFDIVEIKLKSTASETSSKTAHK